MNTERLISIVQDTSLLKNVGINELQEIVNVYPHFAIGRFLLVKKMQQIQHLQLKNEIKKTALVVSNRKKLYQFLYQKELQSTIIESAEIAEIDSIPEIEITNSPTKEVIHTEESSSSFSTPVEIPKSNKGSRFNNPIDFKSLEKEAQKDLDFLEKQILGQTIEHVLTTEIESNYQPKSVTKPLNEPEIETKDKQKFSDWLSILDQDRLKIWRTEEIEEQEENKLSESDIINSFLNSSSNIITPSSNEIEFSPNNLARLSVVDDEGFVTETLAKIYADQGNLTKSIKAYQNLILKYPEKKTYFAARIEKLEKDLK